MSRACAALVAGFSKHVRTGLPFVTLKTAATLDGKTAARDGSSRWITGEEARREVHRLRARAGAVVVGAGTAAADDPSLTVRIEGYEGTQPLRVLVDSSGRTPASGRLFDRAAPLLVATTDGAGAARERWGSQSPIQAISSSPRSLPGKRAPGWFRSCTMSKSSRRARASAR